MEDSSSAGIPLRQFGRTDAKVSILGFGGHHLGDAPDGKTAVRMVQEAVDNGITFYDNCWEYRRGKTELWMGAGLKGRRNKVFLMTKTCPHGRDASLALQMLEESLRRLQTDHLDLWQVHGMAFENDPELFIRPNGAAEALAKAKKDGKARFVGFTGHQNPMVHLGMLNTGFPFDSVQMPLNPFDYGFTRSFERQVLPELNRRGIAVLGMKPLSGHGEPIKAGALTAEEALRYAMSLPVATTITGIDGMDVLHQNLQIAQNFKPMTTAEMDELRNRCKQYAADGRYELYKLSLKFDNPEARLAHGFPLDTKQSEVQDMLGSPENTGHPFPQRKFEGGAVHPKQPHLSRRRFMQGAAIIGAAPLMSSRAFSTSDRVPPQSPEGTVPKKTLGRTGVQVSALGLGGYHLGAANTDQVANEIVAKALDHGIDFFDNAWEYHDGLSEERLGGALKGKRQSAFLMTKVCTHGRDKKVAMRMLEESLRRLQTDHLDLWQIHEVIYENDPDLIFAPGGAAEALLDAKKQGKVRFVGFTGHKDPEIHLKMLAHDFPFDAVQMPLNCFDATFRSFETHVLPEATRRGIAVLGMKSLGGSGEMVRHGGVTAQQGLRYAMSLPVATTISGIDSMEVLDQNLAVATNFQPLTATELKELRDQCRQFAADGRYELFKMTTKYDGKIGREQHHFPSSGELPL